VIRLWAGRLENRGSSLSKAEFFFLLALFTPTLEPRQRSVRLVTSVECTGVDADWLPSSDAEIKCLEWYLHSQPHAFLAYKRTDLTFCTFSEAVRSAHINTRSCLLWAADVLCHDSEQLSCYRSHPHGCRVGHQLWDPQCHSGVVWEGRNKRQGGKFTLGPLVLWSW